MDLNTRNYDSIFTRITQPPDPLNPWTPIRGLRIGVNPWNPWYGLRIANLDCNHFKDGDRKKPTKSQSGVPYLAGKADAENQERIAEEVNVVVEHLVGADEGVADEAEQPRVCVDHVVLKDESN